MCIFLEKVAGILDLVGPCLRIQALQRQSTAGVRTGSCIPQISRTGVWRNSGKADSIRCISAYETSDSETGMSRDHHSIATRDSGVGNGAR